ncbi:hypothetical protein G7Y89_g9739 [Cudoniella acicularis]|uniref:Asp/Glu racemase n=1 Tax=Cudoniella acicularis TaxID=354080 RepID=A0A8H4VZC7_9HELO|nr:hypothetical protein G7Y89_g9739 [Cudoniella acicularis]
MASRPPPIRLGIIVPSSNTALEPLTNALLLSINASLPASSPKLTAHYTRIPITSISLTPSALSQFDPRALLSAAVLLSHANVSLIGWSGTSSGWLGFAHDTSLCSLIEQETGIKATTSILGLNRAMEIWGVKKMGLVTPYMDDVQATIVENYNGIGIEIVERHMGVERNGDIAEVGEEVLDGLVGEVVAGGVDVVSTFCTNLVAAQRVGFWEGIYGVPVFDTVTTVVWDMCRILDVDLSNVKEWGIIFSKK